MKLLTPKQIQQSSNEALSDVLRREHEATKALKAIEAKIQAEKASLEQIQEQKRVELSTINLRIKTRVREEGNIIKELEDRRAAAMEPIAKELTDLEEKRKQIQEYARDVTARHDEIHTATQELRRIDRSIQEKQSSLEQYERETEAKLAKELARAMILSQDAEQRMAETIQEEARVDAKTEQMRTLEENARKAQEKVKAAMLIADDKLYRIKKGEESIENNRRMLALAVKQFKKQGLWGKVANKMENYD